MKRTRNGLVKVTASLAVAIGLILASALPAAAAVSPNQAYGVRATGLISTARGGEGSYPGDSLAIVGHVDIAGLLRTDSVMDKAGPTVNSSRIGYPAVTLLARALLQARAVTSTCTFETNSGSVWGTTAIADGRIHMHGRLAAVLAASPSPNTTITIRRVATITLNKQTTAEDGTLTVTALYITLIGQHQTLSLGTSVCNRANLAPVPILPGRAMVITLVMLGLLVAGTLGYQVGRRRRLTAG
jgi:hypothetical protein